MNTYNSEDKEKAILILSDLVEENVYLKKELLKAHTFLMAQLLNSENGEISFVDSVIRYKEDIEELVKSTGLSIVFNTDKTYSHGDIAQPNRVWSWREPTISQRFKLTKEELINKFEQIRHKNDVG